MSSETSNQSSERQRKSSTDVVERELRERETYQLIHDLIGRHQEFFANSENRLDFLKGTDAAGFYRIAQHINAKLRGERPYELRKCDNEKGAFLPMLHTPSHEDKPVAFQRGYEAIQEYLRDSSDSLEKKLEGVAMASEALIIWVHPFNDGNGRTSRFLGKFIESGASNIDELVAETASSRERGTYYRCKLATKEGLIADANNEDLMLDDDERDEMREKAQSLPNDIDGMYLSVKRLFESDALRDQTKKYKKQQAVAA